jgi:hypothetical protein
MSSSDDMFGLKFGESIYDSYITVLGNDLKAKSIIVSAIDLANKKAKYWEQIYRIRCIITDKIKI